ncbi:hypothetical protein D3C72_1333890 [compost metagenome]
MTVAPLACSAMSSMLVHTYFRPWPVEPVADKVAACKACTSVGPLIRATGSGTGAGSRSQASGIFHGLPYCAEFLSGAASTFQ